MNVFQQLTIQVGIPLFIDWFGRWVPFWIWSLLQLIQDSQHYPKFKHQTTIQTTHKLLKCSELCDIDYLK